MSANGRPPRLTHYSVVLPSSNAHAFENALPAVEAFDIKTEHVEAPRPLCPHCGHECVVTDSRRGRLYMRRIYGCRACHYTHPERPVPVPLGECRLRK